MEQVYLWQALRLLEVLGGKDRTSDEVRLGLVHDVEPLKVSVSAVHDVEGVTIGQQQFEHVDVVDLTASNMNKSRGRAAQIEQGVEYDGAFGTLKVSLEKGCLTQVDRISVEGTHDLIKFFAEVVVDVESPCGVDHGLAEVGENVIVAGLFSIGRVIARDRGADSHVMEPALLCPQADCDGAQVLAVGKLGEGYAPVLVEAGK